MRNNRKNNVRKERVIMLASSALVMAALTMTGVYMRNQSAQEQEDGYSIDFSELDNELGELAQGGLEQENQNPGNPAQGGLAQENGTGGKTDLPGLLNQAALENPGEDDLDYDPMSEVDSNKIEIPGLTDQEALQDGLADLENLPDEDRAALEEEKGISSPAEAQNAGAEGDTAKNEADSAMGAAEDEQNLAAGEQSGTGVTEGLAEGETDGGEMDGELAKQPEEGLAGQLAGQPADAMAANSLQYSEESGLVRPTAGAVLMPYSMDGSIYFATLDQYKYNPAVMLSAEVGDSVSACAAGQVLSVFQDAEIGQAVTLDLGSGYQATYGQLQNLTVSVGSYVNAGDILGYVAAPTKYFSVEGTNLYFQLTKDGIPVNPEALFR